jgi:hypothetical protein
MTQTDTQDDGTGLSRVTLPYIDTSNAIFGPFTIKQTLMLVPGALTLIVSLLIWVSRSFAAAFPLILIGLVLGFVGAQLAISTRWYNSPRERLENLVSYFKLRRSLPWGHDELLQKREHGIRRIFADGTAEMDDGRLVGVVKVDGRNTYKMSENERNQLSFNLASGVDEAIKDFGFRFHSTTRQPKPEELMQKYEDRALDELSQNKYQKELLVDLVDWYTNVDEESWDARETNHYVVVDISPHEVKTDLERSSVESGNSILSFIPNPFSSDDSDERRRRRHMKQTLDDRLATVVSDVIEPLDGVSGERISPDEHACLLLSFWSGQEHTPDGELQHAFKRTHTGPSVWPHASEFQDPNPSEEPEWKEGEVGNETLKDQTNGPQPAQAAADGGTEVQSGSTQAFSPGHFDVHRSYVEVGDQYCKTYWIAEWPVAPESLFLEDLFTMRGVDFDATFHFDPEPKRETISELANDRAAIGAEELERLEAGDVTADDVETDADAYHVFYEMMRASNSQSWRANGYVTVRAGTLQTLKELDQKAQKSSTFEGAKMDALREGSDDIHKTLSGAPADMLPIPPTTRQREAFGSCSPTGRDEYNEATRVDKSTRVLGGAVGALFPFCTGTIQEKGGMDWGRNEHNGSLIRANPFDRGAAPHIITIGQSRSGKTYGSTKAALRWYLEEDDRTLIVCDTQSGFDGLTKICDGEHIVVDGSQTINPLEIQAVPEYMRDSAGGQVDPYRMKVDEAAQFFAGILRSQGVDPGDFMSTIEEALEETYEAAGIYPQDLDSHARESPTVKDFLDTLGDMLENPAEYTHTAHESEAAEKVKRVSQLLDYFSGFKEGGKYSHLVGKSETGLTDEDVDMAYLDLQQFQGQSDAERSSMLHLMLGQVSEKIKRAPGECIFMIDEAHFLLHNDDMASWLEKAAREWARYQACMWFISQHPAEFVSDEGSDASKDKITAQCSTVQLYRTPKVDLETLKKFGLNTKQAREVKDELVTGKSGRGYSECLMQFQDKQGWFPTYVEASPFEDLVINYTPRKHGEFEQYLERNWGAF